MLQACINATTLALINAGVPMVDYVAAVSAGTFSTSPLLDLTALEETDVPNLTLAILPRSGKISLVTLDTRLHVERFEEIFRLAAEAGKVIHAEMQSAVRATTAGLVKAMGGAALQGSGPGPERATKTLEFEDEEMADG